MTAKEHAYRVCLLFRCELEYLDGTEAHKDMRAKELAFIHVQEMNNLFQTIDGNLILDILKEIKELQFKK
jgi:hypothetical protein